MMNKMENVDTKKKKIFVAMSGGIDSSVAAAVLKRQGHNVSGITIDLTVFRRSCSQSVGEKDLIEAAKLVSERIGIPHYTVDFSSDINKYVVDNFVNEYLNGSTPNPCVRCNRYIKFGSLLTYVKKMGADYLATGHYARIYCDPVRQDFAIKKAADLRKDQSYFLYGLKKEALPFLLFPLGDFTKEQVRELAIEYELGLDHCQESQDVCFVSGEGYKKFIEEREGPQVFIPGNFINEKGEIVGEHKGIANYTIGQRDKLGIALGHPAYVYKIDKKVNAVYVGNEERLFARGLYAVFFNSEGIKIPEEMLEVRARIRYNAFDVKGYLTCVGPQRVKLEFFELQRAVTPGQSVVFYLDDIVLGGAIIEEAIQ